jgi:AraC family transcriptional activator of pobA
LDFSGSRMLQSAPSIPIFALYGDIHTEPEPRFVHAETIHTRARVHDWRIAVHRHPHLAQALYLSRGGAAAVIDGERTHLAPASLVWLPTETPHGYEFEPGSDGFVVTISQDFLTAILEAETRQDLGGAMELPFHGEAGRAGETGVDAESCFAGIHRAVGLGGPALRTIVEAHLKLLMALIVRLRGAVRDVTAAEASEAGLSRRFRALAEAHFREHWPIGDYARALGLSEDRLHAVISRATGRPPKEILQRRLALEAKRHLLYTSMTVKEIAYDLGFDDPAYFSRFFTRRATMSPSEYRASAVSG